MKKTLIKICGITTQEDAEAAVSSGADALGFVFYPKSPRCITFESAHTICAAVPDTVMKIGILVNTKYTDLSILETLDFMNYFQIHGELDHTIIERYGSYIIKAFSISDSFTKNCLLPYSNCAFFLFDTAVNNLFGGTGKSFNWKIVSSIPRIKPLILAGGLTEYNVGEAIRTINPYMVDVSSSVEKYTGIKDALKIERFITAVRRADELYIHK